MNLEEYVDHLPQIIGLVVVILLTYLTIKLFANKIRSVSLRRNPSKSTADLFVTLFRFAILLIAGFAVLKIFHLERATTSLLAGAGIAGIVIGFALQDAASNLTAGVTLSAQKQVEVGDLVKIEDHYGVIQKIDLRMTRIRTMSGQMIYYPNKRLISNVIEDFSRFGKRRVEVEVGVGYSSDLDAVKALVLKTIKELKVVRKSDPVEFFYTEISDFKINFEVRYWVDFHREVDWKNGKSQGIVAIKKALDKEGIDIPFPIQTIHIKEK